MKKQFILRSTKKNEYPDLVVECKVILNGEINTYIENISNNKKNIVYKSSLVSAREGILRERIWNKVKTKINDREYIICDKKTIVQKRHSIVQSIVDGMKITGLKPMLDIVYIDLSLDNYREFVCSYEEFCEDYQVIRDYGLQNGHVEEGELYVPIHVPKYCIQLEENIILETTEGKFEVGLEGSYLIYDLEAKIFKIIEKDIFKKTYTIKTYTKDRGIQKKLKRN